MKNRATKVWNQVKPKNASELPVITIEFFMSKAISSSRDMKNAPHKHIMTRNTVWNLFLGKSEKVRQKCSRLATKTTSVNSTIYSIANDEDEVFYYYKENRSNNQPQYHINKMSCLFAFRIFNTCLCIYLN